MDGNQVISAISNLNHNEREHGLKLIYKIFNNILLHPNDAKYCSLNAIRLSQKLSHHTIWFKLLINAGFYESKSDNRLIFDSEKLALLKHINNLCLSYKWKQHYDIDDIKQHKMNNIKLINERIHNVSTIACNEFNNQISEEHYSQLNHCRDKSNCSQLTKFVIIMNAYNKENICDNDMNDRKILQMVNNYLHLMHQHNEDEQFEFIANQLGCCDITKCNIFMRTNRNRNKMYNDDDGRGIYHELMDKMHCYFQHCYDIGNRLSSQDKIKINNNDTKTNDDDDDDPFKQLINQKIIEMNKILRSKRELHKQICGGFSRTSKRYNQLFPVQEHKQNDNTYSFGFKFQYTEYDTDPDERPDDIIVRPKYSSLKEEMTQNNICVMTTEQYNNEYKKAEIHFKSHYKKSKSLWEEMLLE
eukprot:41670_1